MVPSYLTMLRLTTAIHNDRCLETFHWTITMSNCDQSQRGQMKRHPKNHCLSTYNSYNYY